MSTSCLFASTIICTSELLQEERDAFLTEEISAANDAIRSHSKALKSAEAERAKAAKCLQEAQDELAQTRAEKSQADEQRNSALAAFREADSQQNSLMEECAPESPHAVPRQPMG